MLNICSGNQLLFELRDHMSAYNQIKTIHFKKYIKYNIFKKPITNTFLW